MASPTPRSQTAAGEVALGLVIEQPGSSHQVARRLNRRLGSTQFANQTVQNALKRLTARGFVRVAGGEYVATPSGEEHFRNWLYASMPLPPVREELHARIALCQVEGLPRLIGIVRDTELACMVTVQDLNLRVREEERVTAGVRQWSRRAGVIVMAGELAWWEARIKWLENLREDLEEEWQRYKSERGIKATPEAM